MKGFELFALVGVVVLSSFLSFDYCYYYYGDRGMDPWRINTISLITKHVRTRSTGHARNQVGKDSRVTRQLFSLL